ncbi:MAG: hypothetical protein ACXWB9_03575 [Flavisolibacter sp.]
MKYPISILLAFFLISCDKEENDPPAPTNTDHISSSQWQYENGGVDGDKNGTIDLNLSTVGIPDCVLDNKATFNANGSGVADEGATKCDAAHPQTTAFNWNFSNNETTLNIAGSGLFGIGGQFTVTELNANRLSLRKDTTMMGQSVWMVVQFKH